jgi:hypothetical protein
LIAWHDNFGTLGKVPSLVFENVRDNTVDSLVQDH